MGNVFATIGPAVARRVLAGVENPWWCEPYFRLRGWRGGGDVIDLSRVSRVLVVRLDEIGDMVLTTPLLRELRRNLPDAHITLVARPGVVNLLERCPHLDEIIPFDGGSRGWKRYLTRHAGALRLARERLWPREYDLAILPRWDFDIYHATVLAYLSGARRRVGFSEQVTAEKRALNRGFDRLLTLAVDDREPRHEVERHLHLLRALGMTVEDERLEITVDEDDRAHARRVFAEAEVATDTPVAALATGAGARKRQWPLERYIALAGWLHDRHGMRVLVLGGPDDRAAGQAMRQQLGAHVIDATGAATLRQSVALLQQCRLFIGNDSGPMHLAAAAGVPVVEISCHPRTGSPLHAVAPQRFAPWGVPHRILQPPSPLSPCDDGCEAAEPHCITAIKVEQVQAAVEELLRETTL